MQGKRSERMKIVRILQKCSKPSKKNVGKFHGVNIFREKFRMTGNCANNCVDTPKISTNKRRRMRKKKQIRASGYFKKKKFNISVPKIENVETNDRSILGMKK